MKRLRILLVLAALVFMGVAIAHQWDAIAALSWTVNPWFLGISLVALGVLFFLDAAGWHLILKALGVDMGLEESFRIWMISSITRYIPGAIWPYASRTVLAGDYGVPVLTVGVSLYLETILLTASSFAVGLPALLSSGGVSISAWQMGMVMAAFGLLLNPRFIALGRYLPGRLGRVFTRLELPSAARLFGLYVYYLGFWLLFALVFVVFVLSFITLDQAQWIYVGSSMPLAFGVGFVIIIFPGGIGIRESVLHFLLAGTLGSAASLLIAVSSRLWVIVGESLALLTIVPGYRNRNR